MVIAAIITITVFVFVKGHHSHNSHYFFLDSHNSYTSHIHNYNSHDDFYGYNHIIYTYVKMTSTLSIRLYYLYLLLISLDI